MTTKSSQGASRRPPTPRGRIPSEQKPHVRVTVSTANMPCHSLATSSSRGAT